MRFCWARPLAILSNRIGRSRPSPSNGGTLAWCLEQLRKRFPELARKSLSTSTSTRFARNKIDISILERFSAPGRSLLGLKSSSSMRYNSADGHDHPQLDRHRLLARLLLVDAPHFFPSERDVERTA